MSKKKELQLLNLLLALRLMIPTEAFAVTLPTLTVVDQSDDTLTELHHILANQEFESLGKHLAMLQDDAHFRYGWIPQQISYESLVAQFNTKGDPILAGVPRSVFTRFQQRRLVAPITVVPAVLAMETQKVSENTQPESAPLTLTAAHPQNPTEDPVTPTSAQENVSLAPFVEAFQSNIKIEDVKAEWITQEGSKGWQVSIAPSHWSTVSWSNLQPSESDVVPLLSNNTALTLARLAGVTLQSQTGIVFGKFPSGWDVEFSGRAEHPLFLDNQDPPRADYSSKMGGYFVMLNAAPGAQLIYLTSRTGYGTGAVTFPVMAGTATYLDLTEITSSSLTGKVLSVNNRPSGEANYLKNVIVRVIGQASAVTSTDPVGAFALDNVLTFSDYPFFIETDKGSTGFTHRYRMAPGNMDQVSLFRIPSWQIRDYLGQLEGGVSSSSGVVVAALPHLVNSHPGYPFIPSVRSIPSSTSLVPETYTFSPENDLHVNSPLIGDSNRFLGVEIPEGPVVTQVTDENKNVIWSELNVSSPGVINVVGPY